MATPVTLVDANGIEVGTASDPFVMDGPTNSFSRKVADGQVKAGAGMLVSVVISPTGAVTAGVLTLYDSLTETGTVIYSVSLPVTTFATISMALNVPFGTGLYVGFDATLAGVQVLVSYR